MVDVKGYTCCATSVESSTDSTRESARSASATKFRSYRVDAKG